MTVTIYHRENVTSTLAALFASVEGDSEYDQGRRTGVLLVATALGIPLSQLDRGLSQEQQPQPRLHIIDQQQSTRRLTSGR